MALSFYLNEINNNSKINVQTNASFTSKVGDFDVGTFAIEWNRTKNKIAPYTKLFIVDSTNNDTWCFVVLNDNVEVVHKTPEVLYVHNLTVIQNTYELTTHLVRNSRFTQPIAPKKAKLKATAMSIINATHISVPVDSYAFTQDTELYFPYDETNQKYIYYYEKTTITKREKIKRAYIDITTFTKVFEYCNISGNDNTCFRRVGSTRKFKKNYYTVIYFTINKYDGLTLIDSLNVHAENGQQILEIDPTFFESDYSYELKINTSEISELDLLDNSEISCFPTGNEPSSEETWKIPGISTILDCSLNIETYYYSLMDILRILRDQCAKTYNGESNNPNLYLLQDDGVLEKTVAPNLYFTSQDLWTCVANTLKYIDAIPTIDENNYLGYEYLNDYSRDSIVLEKADEKSSLSNQYYTNSLVANYQNARQENAVVYPAEFTFKRVSSKVYGVPGVNDYEMSVDKPIDYIDKVYILLENSNLYDYQIQFRIKDDVPIHRQIPGTANILFEDKLPNGYLDISDAIYEQSLYSLLPWDDEDATVPNQLNTLYYVRNSNSIYVGGIRKDSVNEYEYEVYKKAVNLIMMNMFGIPEQSVGFGTFISISYPYIYNLQYCIKYHAIFDGRASQESITEKHKGETYTTQEEGGVNLNRMGNNMQGLIARLGNEVENITIPVTNYGSRIKKGSLWVDDDGKKYIANSVKTTFSTSSQIVMVEAQFSRNFNLISQFTKIDQEKRFYEISNSLVSKGYENIVEFLYFSTKAAITTETTAFENDALDSILKDNFIEPSTPLKVDIATIDSYDMGGDVNPAVKDIYIPFHVYGLGNSICFEMGFSDAINAADRLVNKTVVISGVSIDKLLNETCLYTSEDGFADKVNVRIYSRNDEETIYIGDQFPQMLLDVEFPLLPAFDAIKIVDIQNYYYYKKPNEIFHLNYSLAFMPSPDEEIFFGDILINRNAIIREMIPSNPSKEFHLYAGNEQYSIIDNKVIDNHTDYGTVSISYTRSNGLGTIVFELDNGSITSAKAWAIADSEGNIYFAANEKLANKTSVKLYFGLRRNRF